MVGVNNKYNIEIEVLSPLSIGAGAEKDWVRGIDFVVYNGKAYKLSLKKMLNAGLSVDELSGLFSSKNEDAIISKLKGNLESVSDRIMNIPVLSDNDIKVFVENQLSGDPIIPGSSLKGAIRSVLFNYLEGKSKDGSEVFGSSTKGDDFMRFIKFSDSSFEHTELINSKIFNLQNNGGWKGGWKHGSSHTNDHFRNQGFNTLYECLVPHEIGYSSLMLCERLFENFEKNKKTSNLNKNADKKRPILKEGLSRLFSIINKYTKDYLKKERDFFIKYSTDKTDRIVSFIDAILDKIPADNSYCILKMAAGSGFHSITGDWQHDDYSINGLDTAKKVSRGLFNGKKSAKSRKIAVDGESFYLMGFVKLSSISDEKMFQFIQNRKIEEERRLKEEQERIRLEEEKKQREENERLEQIRLQKEAEEKKKREFHERIEQYDSLIKATEELFSNQKYNEALQSAQEASDLYPEGEKHTILINEISIILNKAKRLNAGLSFLLEKKMTSDDLKIDELSNGIKRVKQFIEKNSVVLNDSDVSNFHKWLGVLPKPTKKSEIKEYSDFNSKSWVLIAEIFDANVAKQWFEELNN